MKHHATYYLIIINIILFFLPFLGFDLSPFMFSREALLSGSYHVVITHMFFHVSPLHLALNMIALLAFGMALENEFGTPILLGVYFTSGILAAVLFSFTSSLPAIGASGAVFGLMSFLAFTKPFKFSIFPFIIPLPISLIAIIYTISTILLLNQPSLVGHWAHLGGLAAGTLLAFAFFPAQAKSGLLVIATMALIVILLPHFL